MSFLKDEINRDLKQSGPNGGIFFLFLITVVSFLPVVIADMVGASESVRNFLIVLALPFLAIGLAVYLFHQTKALVRPFTVGEDEIACPNCSAVLPDPDELPEDEKSNFSGWICSNCNVHVDRYGHEIIL